MADPTGAAAGAPSTPKPPNPPLNPQAGAPTPPSLGSRTRGRDQYSTPGATVPGGGAPLMSVLAALETQDALIAERATIVTRRARAIVAEAPLPVVSEPSGAPDKKEDWERKKAIFALAAKNFVGARPQTPSSTVAQTSGVPRPQTPASTAEQAPDPSGASRPVSSVADRDFHEFSFVEERVADAKPAHDPEARTALVGLALSGGGIRSATFALGVLQALGENSALWMFDYCSTVSGGGFAGGWWSAWLSRRDWNPKPVPAPTGTAGAGKPESKTPQTLFPQDERLEPDRFPPRRLDDMTPTATAALRAASAASPEGSLSAAALDPIHHVRLFANYLTPLTGILSSDTWRAVMVISRNLVLTWLVLGPLLLAAMLIGQLYFAGSREYAYGFACSRPDSAYIERLASAPVCSGAIRGEQAQRLALTTAQDPVVLTRIARDTSATIEAFAAGTRSHGDELVARSMAISDVVITALLITAAFTLVYLVYSAGSMAATLVPLIGLGFALYKLFQVRKGTPPSDAWAAMALRHFAAGFWFPIALFGVAVVVGWWGLVPALMTAKKNAAAQLDDPNAPTIPMPRDEVRTEIVVWHTRALMVACGLLVLLVVAGFGHEVIWYFFDPQTGTVAAAARKAGGWSALLIAAASGIFTLIRGFPSSKAPDQVQGEPSGMEKMALGAAPLVVLVALALACASFGHWMIAQMADWPEDRLSAPGRTAATAALQVGAIVVGLLGVYELYSALKRRSQGEPMAELAFMVLFTMALAGGGAVLIFPTLDRMTAASALEIVAIGWAGFLVAWVIGLGWTSDPNLIALHAFYKARIVRAYLGASNAEARRDVEITEAARGDDIPLKDLKNHERGAAVQLINTTLNLVGGHDLQTSQRSAAPFVLSSIACGSARVGYRPTDEYMSGTLSLGTAVAASGAAVSPNMGSKTNSSIALLLALFNVRLGFWAPTPNRSRWRDPQPRMWPVYLLSEALSQTNDLRRYCYLTDGGHFDNTGIYSLVERGCQYIVVLDDGADSGPEFSDMGDVLRRVRIDFGTEIGLADGVAAFTPEEKSSLANKHYVKGTIRYSEPHLKMLGWTDAEIRHRKDGVIIWIKPSVVKGDSVDVRQYNIENPTFPQQTTADQWYDEAQFESYRALGYQSVAPLVQVGVAPKTFGEIDGYFREKI